MPALFLSLALTVAAFGQECPSSDSSGSPIDSESGTLEGQLVYHDGIRKWFELKLDKPQCGQASIQLVVLKGNQNALETLRGCHVRSTGSIYESPTGYYSRDVAQDVTAIEPVGSCERKPRFTDFSKARLDPSIRAYRVEMLINYEPGDHPVQFRVTSNGKALTPWQAYASYSLTGGFVLYGKCAEGFMVNQVYGARDAQPGHFTARGESDDMAMFDAESEVYAGIKLLRLGYSCVRRH